MKQLLNTLYITLPDVYVGKQGETLVVKDDKKVLGRVPLHNLDNVVLFNYVGMSPALLEECHDHGVSVAYLTTNGRFIGRFQGASTGNILLRRIQYRVSDDAQQSLAIARNIILAKIYNEKWILERYIRQYGSRIDTVHLQSESVRLSESINNAKSCLTMDDLRGIEGAAQEAYFSCFDEMILNQKEDFTFDVRSRRPPLNRVNALLSFFYSVMGNDIASALETVGLDAYAGFMHVDRPGRISLALDLLEEFRGCIVDRFLLSLINKKEIAAKHFTVESSGAVLLNDEGRREALTKWRERKLETITHPYLDEKMPWGLVPFVQANLLARYLRGDIDAYPPFFWK
ncbi:MAG: type I-C CRISPR-associated endonuclease Cas1c [Acidaminococcus sp.]|jgi:CRISPR-associated protein Cas1|nr:type I-C CRISPR-associated endonuclease Cas1c [Acidaminococcus sp.]MCI2100918.1 type I-C CRISPR-associated endonuclease Cas1c [Acidaminococcus sp.]MCI2115248.1 type I-C CRISPR-associated endonuclease Cas1c [Acidaminococcus sp.]